MNQKYDELIKKAKKTTARIKEIEKDDPRFARVLGFFKAKKLISRDGVQPLPHVHLNIEEALWVAEVVEPRILEVLPAAILHYPASMKNLSKLPPELDEIIDLIRNNQQHGPAYRHVAYETFFKWAQYCYGDKRLKPEKDKRVTCSYRISKDTKAKLEELARQKGLPVSRIIDSLV